MYSTTPDIIPIKSPLKPKLFTDNELTTLKESTLRLLDEVGVHFPSERSLKIFSEHGARVNRETSVVQIPPEMVIKAMTTAPRTFTLAGREERLDLLLDGESSYLCTDGTGIHVIDLETREQRDSTKADIALMARVSDALPLIGFYWPMVSAKDYGHTAPIHGCHAGLTNTLKHVRGGTTMHPQLAQYVVEMAIVVAGSEKNLKSRPPICANICTLSPLGQDKHGIETALLYAEAGIPVSFMAMPTMGSTAPAAPYGALIQGDAEVISAMVLLQLVYPGTPVFHAVFSSLMDPRTGGYISEVPTPSYMMAKELAHAWNLPSLGGARLSGDAPSLGWQSGFEVGLGAALVAMTGGEICGLLGLVASATTLYPEEIILDHEACLHVLEMLNGSIAEDLTTSISVIEGVGPRGHFLAQKHTRTHIRDFELSLLFRQKKDDGGSEDPREVAVAEFKRIEASHNPQPLADEVLSELDRILNTAEIEAEKLYGK
jgi:trimethylamine--corrinoid protein Co-methyltransferase